MLYNAFGVIIVKNASATQSTTIDISRTSLVWLFFLIIPLTTANGTVITETFNIIKFAGFFLITLGTLYYNHIIKFPSLDCVKKTICADTGGCYLEEKGTVDLKEPLL